MKLFYSKGACSLAVRIIINEIGLKVDFEEVDLKTKQTKSGQNYLDINPKGAVPCLLLDNNAVLTENTVIQQYLADSSHAYDLLPPQENFQRYRVLEWLNFAASDLHKNFGPLFNPNMPIEVKDNIAKPLLIKKFMFVDTNLNNKDYLLGDKFTLPDSYLFVVLRWAHAQNLDIEQCANLKRYYALLQTRKAVQQSLQEEGIQA